MLDFQRLILQDFFHNDPNGLCIMAQGLGYTKIIAQLLQFYLSPRHLVILLGEEVERLKQEWLQDLKGLGLEMLTCVENEVNRGQFYAKGGIIHLSTVQLLTDLLNQNIPIHLITGICVLNAEKLSHGDAFCLKLFRQGNKKGWIRAFSQDPEAWNNISLEKQCRQLLVRQTFLWPRFQVHVSRTLDTIGQPETTEFKVEMSPSMIKIQNSIMNCLGICLKELIKGARLDSDETTLEMALFSNFDQKMQSLLFPTWHLLSQKTKSLLTEISTLRKLLEYLTTYDAVSFFSHLESILLAQRDAFWIMLEEADLIYVTARARCFVKPDIPPKLALLPANVLPTLEPQPKWIILRGILQDLDKKGPVLIMCKGNSVVKQLSEYLSSLPLDCQDVDPHGQSFLMDRLQKYFAWKNNLSNMVPKETVQQPQRRGFQRRRVRGAATNVVSNKNKVLNMVQEAVVLENVLLSDDVKLDLQSLNQFGLQDSMTLVRAYGNDDASLLQELRPSHVVLYDPDMKFVRELEVYKAMTGLNVTVSFMLYQNGIEEQRYLSTIRKEKDVFEKLIREKSVMVIPLDDGEVQQDVEFNPRIAGGGRLRNQAQSQIVVDTRELRSSLPSLIHANGINLAVKTLEVGDYVLTPTMCVERKSISDLIGSFKSGRLYTQVEAMDIHYAHPILLIEFSNSKAFSFNSVNEIKNDISLTDIQSKLVLLTKSFPKLKLLWSSSPQATAEMFQDLKMGQEEPDAEQAASVGAENLDNVEGSYTITPVDILRALPGVNTKNVKKVMNNVDNVLELVSMDQHALSELLGPEMARTLYMFCRKDGRNKG